MPDETPRCKERRPCGAALLGSSNPGLPTWPEQVPEQVPEQAPEQAPEQVPEQVPEQAPEQAPE